LAAASAAAWQDCAAIQVIVSEGVDIAFGTPARFFIRQAQKLSNSGWHLSQSFLSDRR
jgi:hypothetical protein